MDLTEIKKSFEKIGLKETGEKCKSKLIEDGYVYAPHFGWEKISTLEKFALNPNEKGVPCVLKPKWVESKSGNTDKYGNKVVGGIGGEKWVQHPTEKEWYPSDNWLAYIEYKKNINKRLIAEELIPLPNEM